MKKILNNYWFHFALLATCAVIMILDVVFTKANSFETLTFGKIAGIIFTVDILGYLLYLMIRVIKDWGK